jgi:hypothetical protein
MRVLAILALALLLAGCEGDRMKHGSMNQRQAQPQSMHSAHPSRLAQLDQRTASGPMSALGGSGRAAPKTARRNEQKEAGTDAPNITRGQREPEDTWERSGLRAARNG